MVKVGIEGTRDFVTSDEINAIDAHKAFEDVNALHENGWLNLPAEYNARTSKEIKSVAAKIRNESEVFVIIGIGGSYLGARAAIEYIISPNYNALPKKSPDIYFAGNNASDEYLWQVIELIGDRDFSVNVVSKSGSTIEPSIALRFFKSKLKDRYGVAGLRNRLYVTTDSTGSPLRETARREKYSCLEMPPRVGGRYSVLTSVGLLPCAVAGIDIDDIMAGALKQMQGGFESECLYASTRQALYRKGKKIEMLACFEPAFRYTGEWWKQLYGESEGKDGKGIFPAYSDYTADLHSLGQYVQEGERTLMETFVTFEGPRVKMQIPSGTLHDDKIGALSGMDLYKVNAAASEAVKKAHIGGGVPVMELMLPKMTANSFGALAYFFKRSCAISSIISGVSPFGQPGVEAYKNNIYEILGMTK